MITRQTQKSFGWISVIFAGLAAAAGAGIALLVTRLLGPVKSAAAVLGMAVASLALIRTDLGLIVFVLITYIRLSDVAIDYYGAPSIAKPFVALLIIAILIRWFFNKERPQGWEPPALLISLYGFVIGISLLYAVSFDAAQGAASDYFKDAVIAIVTVILLSDYRTFRRVIWALIIAGLFMGSISVFQYLTGTFGNIYWGFGIATNLNIIGETQGIRIGGPIGDPNAFAQIMIVVIPLAFGCIRTEQSVFLKMVALAAFAISVLTVIFTFSRGAFVAMLIMLFAMVVYRPPRLTEIFFTAIMVILLFKYVPSTYLLRLTSLSDLFSGQGDVRTEVSFRGRASEAIVGWQMFLDRPLLGVGMRNYPVLYQEYSRRLGYDPRTEQREPHNLYLEVAAETGLAGLAAFGSILAITFYRLRKARTLFRDTNYHTEADMVAFLTIGIIGYLSTSMFLHGVYPRYLYLLIGIACALPQIANSYIAYHHE